MYNMRASLILAAMLPCVSAHADWQYTSWGMTPEHAMAASHGELHWCDAQCKGENADNGAASLFGDYQIGELKLRAFALFDKKTSALFSVRARLVDAKKSNILREAFRVKYGEPETQQDASNLMRTFVWYDHDDMIVIREIGFRTPDVTTVIHQPKYTFGPGQR